MLFRESLSRLLESEADFEIAGHCASVQEALAVLGRREVDLVLLDFDLGQDSAFQFIGRIRELPVHPKILMVTAGMTRRGSGAVDRARGIGIFPEAEFAGAADRGDPEDHGGRGVAGQEFGSFTGASGSSPTRPEFTEREREVLRGVFEGLTNKEIAAQVSVSESTVKAGLQQLFQKTGVRTRSQLVRIALEQYAGQWQ